MTRSASESRRLQDVEDYVSDMQDLFDETLNLFHFKHNKIDELSYKRLSLERFGGKTIDEAAAHFHQMFDDFKACAEKHLLNRIRQGEVFIESLERNDKRRERAQEKLASLIHELGTLGG